MSVKVLSLIIHELAHEEGMHCENSYHEALSDIGAKLVNILIKEPTFFEGI